MKTQLKKFGFPHSKSEAFCTALFAQALSLSNSFCRATIDFLGFDSDFKLIKVECEEHLPDSKDTPDVRIEIGDRRNGYKVRHLIIIESKVDSGESGTQLIKYGTYIDKINEEIEGEFETAKLVLLSKSKDLVTSREPDLRITWNEVLELIREFPKEHVFEESYFSQVYGHLKANCYVAKPSGNLAMFQAMCQRLCFDRPWLTYRRTQKQFGLVVDQQDPWIKSRRLEDKRDSRLVGFDSNPPKLNTLPQTWLKEWLPQTEKNSDLFREIWRHARNAELIEKSLDELLKIIDQERSQS